jgi:hypothetical protein
MGTRHDGADVCQKEPENNGNGVGFSSRVEQETRTFRMGPARPAALR